MKPAKRTSRWHCLWYACGLLAATAAAQEGRPPAAVEMEGTTIIGSQELPKVLYIVPWRPAPPGEWVVRPFRSLHEEILAPVDRAVLRRQLEWRRQLQDHAAQTHPEPEE